MLTMPTKYSNGNTGSQKNTTYRPAILCFSHLRWAFVYQRPQHLLSRAALRAEVFFWEEPIYADIQQADMRVAPQPCGVQVLTPLLPFSCQGKDSVEMQRALLDQWLADRDLSDFSAWYYTPMALLFTSHLRPDITVYDCMDQLSAFQGAPPELVELEQRLFELADVVFAGGKSLYEAKYGQHSNLHLFPSSIDRAHFAASRKPQADPADQISIPHPRIGFFGVLDERLDRDLLREVAACEPSCQFVLIGPVVKIREEELPHAPNIHYLGQKQYGQLPSYIAHWDAAMLPFAQNASTRFISPTKTPEYLAAGKPVISTPVRDVAEPYGRLGLARIAANAEEFCAAIKSSLAPQDPGWLPAVDEFLRNISWDRTFQGMWDEVLRCRTSSGMVDKQEEAIHV
jgi:glycosyltransferase involved in cell wall biosynthesis